jgi:hypothetical protein
MPRAAFLTCLAAALLAHAGLAWLLQHGTAPSASHAGAVAGGRHVAVQLIAAPRPAQPAVPRSVVAPEPAQMRPLTEADAPQAEPAPPPAPQRDVGTLEPRFAPPAELDAVARPRSTLDIAALQGLSWSGLPIRLRLFVDVRGTVVDVVVLQANEGEQVLRRLRQMFLATAFIPGRVAGVDVASYRDIELTLTDRAG